MVLFLGYSESYWVQKRLGHNALFCLLVAKKTHDPFNSLFDITADIKFIFLGKHISEILKFFPSISNQY